MVVEKSFVTARIAPKAGDVYQYDFDMRVGASEPVNPAAMPGYYAFQAGPLLLGYKPVDDPAATLRSPNPAEATFRAPRLSARLRLPASMPFLALNLACRRSMI